MATASRPGTERAPRATRIGVIAVLVPLCGFSVMNVIVKLSLLQALAFAFYRLRMGTAVMLVALLATGRRLTPATLLRASPAGRPFGTDLGLFLPALQLASVTARLIP